MSGKEATPSVRIYGAAGWLLALVVIAGLALSAVNLFAHLQGQVDERQQRWRALVGDVRACRQSVRPMPSWKVCEERVQAQKARREASAP